MVNLIQQRLECSLRTLGLAALLSCCAALTTGCGGNGGGDESAAAASTGSGGNTFQLNGIDTMQYDVTEITAAAGSEITVKVTNTGNLPKAGMAHNFVLLKLGTDANQFAMSAAMAMNNGYIPPDGADSIIAMTELAGPGETMQVTFTVPTAPGRYDYICTFPGHFLAGMRGVLIVQ